ncbi:ABC transporter permease [Oscillatoria sp. FACHB-1407]|uniref:ABC transporter permease n=1 Tax=Oscillatoria sp. FACHB-1407 TaxID=2692847 RepID=UPI0016835A83|nr:ABC transporter permease [Oscillatoria sp. FACHB-1407]MBD2462098.1 ABC transporter permease [Oscillatoria sp. FACHB-1407]
MSLAPIDLLKLTYRSLSGNPLRSVLTALGVFMGVTAVSATLQVGHISQAVIARRLATREAPHASLFPDWQPNRIRLQQDDITFLQQRLPGLQSISALNWARSTEVTFQDQTAPTSVVAVTQDFLFTTGNPVIAGRSFTAADYASYRPVVIIDELLAAQLFGNANPIGQRIYANQQPYVVVGVVQTKLRDDEEPSEGRLLITSAFHNALTGRRDVGSIRLRPYYLDDLEKIGEQAEELLMQRFPGQRFSQWNNVEDILEQRQVLKLTARSLAAVGAIALLVGGVGIANIMIASVTERTAEIGLRRAIGATRNEIMVQFILEATLLSLVGGILAIATVHGLTLAIAERFELPYEFDATSATIALGSALSVGVGASFAPALRASQIDPVKALRSE